MFKQPRNKATKQVFRICSFVTWWFQRISPAFSGRQDAVLFGARHHRLSSKRVFNDGGGVRPSPDAATDELWKTSAVVEVFARRLLKFSSGLRVGNCSARGRALSGGITGRGILAGIGKQAWLSRRFDGAGAENGFDLQFTSAQLIFASWTMACKSVAGRRRLRRQRWSF